MTRRLLPYEHQLIEALGISEAEYLEFAQAQFDYSRTPADKLATPQNWETVAIVLTIVGVLFQVGAALLAPKPELPSQIGRRQRREERFSPRFGFNSAQELAKYGDPVNLVYCNTDQNTTGGVRVATSLIWSAVSSFGSSQFMQNLLVLGASNINQLDLERTAFGQTAIRQFLANKVWTYYNSTGNVRFSNVLSGGTNDPTRTGVADYVYRANVGGRFEEGFSQAFSPTSLTKCGIYSTIPLNIVIQERDGEGDQESADLGISVDSTFVSTYWRLPRPLVPIGARMTLTFQSSLVGNKSVQQSAAEARRNMYSSLDPASTYKLGSAKFRLAQPLSSSDLDSGSLTAVFECIEAGYCPAEDYITTRFQNNEKEYTLEIAQLNTRNAEIDTLLLNPPPIYAPITVTNKDINGQLNTIILEKEKIATWLENVRGFRRARKTNGFEDDKLFLAGLANDSLNDTIINQIVEELNFKLDRLDDTPDKSDRQRLRKEIVVLERELNRAIHQYGVVNMYVRSERDPGKVLSGREEILALKKLLATNDLTAWRAILGATSVTGGGRDFAAEQVRDDLLRTEKTENLERIAELEELLENPDSWNDYFYTKCLAKFEEASYEVIAAPRLVNFSLKAKVFQRISGRSRYYGDEKVKQYRASDNGYKLRTSMFWLWYKRNTETTYRRVRHVFAVRRGADLDNFIDLTFDGGANNGTWQFKLEPIAETAAEFLKYGANESFAYIENNGTLRTISNNDGTSVYFVGDIRAANGNLPPLNNNPYHVDEWGLFANRSDTQIDFSFSNGPEIGISAVTEQRVENLSTYPRLYDKLSLLGLNAYSGKGIEDLRSITVFVTKGKLVRKLNDDGTYSATPDVATSYLPEIFLDTILDTTDGIGQYAKVAGIDLVALAKAKRFCQTNNLFFDGVIADPTSWRQFWAETAPFSLLELGRIGGKETLIPAVPCDNAGNITRTVPITAMFTAGNILEDSYKEEFIDYGSSVQDLIATVIYRNTELNGVFPRNASVDVSLKDVSEPAAIRQTFDLSQYVTNRNQAILYAKLLCQQRRHIKRNIEFRTFPTDAPLSPGAYIYVDIGQQEWQSIYSGQVESNGVLNVPLTQSVPDGTYSVLLYRSGSGVISTSAAVTDNIASGLANYEGWLFVLGTTVKAKRVFRIVEVQMDEEGEISVRATEHPCDSSGQSLIADFNDELFTVR